MSQGLADIEFGGPAIYRIVVNGRLSANWAERIAGMAISDTTRKGKSPQTTLIGRIRDQAELNGVLDTLYGLHLTILRVETVDEEGGAK